MDSEPEPDRGVGTAPLTFTGTWWTVTVAGQDEPAFVPAVSAKHAVWTAQAAILELGQHHKAKSADPATRADVERWLKGYEQQTADPLLPNPSPWRQTIYEILRTQVWDPDRSEWIAPPGVPEPPVSPPATSSRPLAPTFEDSALQATGRRLSLIGRPTLLAIGLLALITLQGAALLPNLTSWFILLTSAESLTFAVFVSEWLNRIDSPPMKWCPHCSATVPRAHRHQKGRNYADEKQRRAILDQWRQTAGNVCQGTEHCDPTGHPSDDLTVDHYLPQSYGGTLTHGYRIICRQANSARGNKPIGA